MKRLRRTRIAYIVAAAAVSLASVVYQIFGRGVFSYAMSLSFLYPLVLGIGFTSLLMPLQKRLPFVGTSGYRLFNNLYASGIAILSGHAYLLGILEIAGTNSSYLIWLFIAGCALVAAGLVTLFVLLRGCARYRRHRSRPRPPQRV